MALTVWTKRFSFRSVHSLPGGLHPEKTHGHQYFLEVTVKDFDLSVLVQEVSARIIKKLDGRDLTPFVQPPTGEVIVEWIDHELRGSPVGASLVAVALQETRKNRFLSASSEARYV